MHETLVNCRLVNRAVGHIAINTIFRHIALSTAEDGIRFLNIAQSLHLRACVRGITCDTDVGGDYEYHLNECHLNECF